MTLVSHKPSDTEALGFSWGQSVGPGTVIGLSGPLGAGKTQLVKGLARGLGIEARIHSPTFTLVNVYQGGRVTLFHLDLFRLDTPEQIEAAGLEDYLHPAGVTVIEWADKLFATRIQNPESRIQNPESAPHHVSPESFRGSRLIQAEIEILSDTERRITYEDSGS